MDFPVISLESKIAVGFEEEPHVVVEMRRNAAARRDGMDVEIEGARRDEVERRETGFFDDLAARHRPEVWIAVRVPAGLEPAAQGFVMDQQESPPLAIDHEGRGGEMAREIRAIETVRIVVDKCGDCPELFAITFIEQQRGLEDVEDLAATGIDRYIHEIRRARPVAIHSAQSGLPLRRARTAASFHG